jgi:hypothetical protein
VETPSLPGVIEGAVNEYVIYDPRGEVFRFEVTDWAGISSCADFHVERTAFAPSRDLLLVDDFRAEFRTGWADGNGVAPSDMEHDLFWFDMLEGVADFRGWDDVIDVFMHTQLSLPKLLDYRAIVWSVSTGFLDGRPDQSLLPRLIRYGPEVPQPGPNEPTAGILAQYLRGGGLIMIVGWYPLSGAIDGGRFALGTPRFPLVYKYELDGDQDGNYDDQTGSFVGDESFPNRDLCVSAVDYTNLFAPLIRTTDENGCGRIFDFELDENLRSAEPIDAGFPSLTLRPEAAGPGRAYESEGLQSELYNPQYFSFCHFSEYMSRACFEPIYGIVSVDHTAATNGSPVAFWTSASPEPGPRSAVFGVPLVYSTNGGWRGSPSDSLPVAHHVVEDGLAPVGSDDVFHVLGVEIHVELAGAELRDDP